MSFVFKYEQELKTFIKFFIATSAIERSAQKTEFMNNLEKFGLGLQIDWQNLDAIPVFRYLVSAIASMFQKCSSGSNGCNFNTETNVDGNMYHVPD